MKYLIRHPNAKYHGVCGGLQFQGGEAVLDTMNTSCLDGRMGKTPDEILNMFKGWGCNVEAVKAVKTAEPTKAVKIPKPIKPKPIKPK